MRLFGIVDNRIDFRYDRAWFLEPEFDIATHASATISGSSGLGSVGASSTLSGVSASKGLAGITSSVGLRD